jgi:hypothetical protein
MTSSPAEAAGLQDARAVCAGVVAALTKTNVLMRNQRVIRIGLKNCIVSFLLFLIKPTKK